MTERIPEQWERRFKKIPQRGKEGKEKNRFQGFTQKIHMALDIQ